MTGWKNHSDFWTDDRIARLKELWDEPGEPSYTKIAKAIGDGCTRNMVAGKVHRLELPLRTGKTRPNGDKHPPAAAKRVA